MAYIYTYIYSEQQHSVFTEKGHIFMLTEKAVVGTEENKEFV